MSTVMLLSVSYG